MRVLGKLGLGGENTGEFIIVQWPKIQNGDGDGDEVPHVCLRLGLTDYRTFVGTNLSSLWERFLVTSEDDSVRCRHTSSPLGNGAVIETSDKKIIVLRRSDNVGEFPGHYVFPGGHPEPIAVGIDDSHQLEKDGETSELLNKKVAQEMFDSIINEVVEETGIPASSLSSPLFIGISRRELNVRPAMFFFIKCSHHSDEIPRLYSIAEDGFESTQLHTGSMDELKTMTSRMPGCHHGGFALYELMLQRLKNTDETLLTST
ncbi:nudix hydrolase 9 isoform X2 [Eutrema salsugineum]|uniref:nudix hydrolase 9 isoform X2 n=1 Tax=Eutrema salsugineum TaxID=72664 RepID=UPI000CED3FE3|nr:nudix hydrolase 9 isoform X2 [Eutrema salsugineum]